MPAGDLIVADWQFEVRTTLLGDGTDYDVVNVIGIDGQNVKTADLNLLGDGTALGVDRLASRSIVLTIEAAAATASAMSTLLTTFGAAWAIGGDVELHWQVGGVHKYVTGRTRQWEVADQRRRAFGLAVIDAEFFAGDPTITVV